MKIYKICSILASVILSVWIVVSNIIYVMSYKHILTAMPLGYTIGFNVIKLIVFNVIIWAVYFIVKSIVLKKHCSS